MNIKELEKLFSLKEKGAVSEQEYQEAKQRLLAEGFPPENHASKKYLGMSLNQYCMVIHLSQLASFLLPLAGIIVPVVLWAMEKDKNKDIDTHGRLVINWLISKMIYLAVSVALMLVLIGIPLLFIVMILGIIFPIIGTIRASDGRFYRYPLSIPFMNTDSPAAEE